MPTDTCGCDPDRILDFVYLGPDEGIEHQAEVAAAQKIFCAERAPNFSLRTNGYPRDRVWINKHDLSRESLVMRPIIAERVAQGRNASQIVSLDAPVLGRHLKYIGQFLYTGDYAIESMDVEMLALDSVRYPNGCTQCANHLRLLKFHLGLFHSARYLGMEMLELLAMSKFSAAAEHATSTVLRYVMKDVYTIEPETPDFYPGTYSLASWVDYRPMLILPAVMSYVRKHRPAIQTHYDIVQVSSAGYRIIDARAAWPEPDQFEMIRKQIPELDRDMQWVDMTLAQEIVEPMVRGPYHYY